MLVQILSLSYIIIVVLWQMIKIDEILFCLISTIYIAVYLALMLKIHLTPKIWPSLIMQPQANCSNKYHFHLGPFHLIKDEDLAQSRKEYNATIHS